VHAQDGGTAGKLQAQLRGQRGQVVERSGVVQHAAGPADASRHRRVAFHQVEVADGVGRGGVGCGLLAGQDVTVGVPAQHGDPGQAAQPIEHLGRPDAEQDQVTQHPPAVHVIAGRVVEHRAQRHVVAVDIGDDAQLHVPSAVIRARSAGVSMSSGRPVSPHSTRVTRSGRVRRNVRAP
jgi:hypothetical protein